MDIEATRQRIIDVTTEYLVNGDGAVPLVISVFPGGGKTTNVIRVLFGYRKDGDGRITTGLTFKFIYLAPRHDVIRGGIDNEYFGDYVWFKSRLKECNHPDVVKLLAERKEMEDSYFPVEYFCSSCQFKGRRREDATLATGEKVKSGVMSQCKYEINKREIESNEVPSWAGVHHHIITYLKGYLDGVVDTPGGLGGTEVVKKARSDIMDVLIVEENPMKTLMETAKATKEDLAEVQIELERFSWFLKTFPAFCNDMDFSEHVETYRGIIDFLLGEIDTCTRHPVPKTRRGRKALAPDEARPAMCPARPPTKWERLQELIDEWRLLGWDDFDVYWIRYLGKRVFEDIEKHGMNDDAALRFNPTIERLKYVSKALGLFHRLLGRIFDRSAQEKLKYHFAIVDENWKQFRDVYINVNYFHDDVLPGVKCKIIALDGTGDKGTWEKILGKTCTLSPEPGRYDNVTRVSYSGESQYCAASYIDNGKLRETTGRYMMELAALIIKKRPGMTAVIGSKPMEKFFKEVCDEQGVDKDSWKYAPYYGLTSSNDMRRCDTIVLLSTPRPPEIQMEAAIQLSGWDRDLWERYFIDNEMIQAIARVRPVLDDKPTGMGTMMKKRDEPVHIYVFGARDIFSGGREQELVKDHYRQMTPAMLEGMLKYGGDGKITWTKTQLRAVAPILASFGEDPIYQKEVMDRTKLTWKMVKDVTNHLVDCGILTRDKGGKLARKR